MITLNGSGSYDPLGEALTYGWTQVSGPTVVISNANPANATFPGLGGQTYAFRLTVKNTDGLTGSATTTVGIQSPTPVRILVFQATPSQIAAGQSSTLNWVVENGATVDIEHSGQLECTRPVRLGESDRDHHLHHDRN